MGTRTLTVRIPAGVKDGQRIRLKGKGAPGRAGRPGRRPVRHRRASRRTALFGRSGDNLTLTVPVTFAEAALGGEVRVPTLGGAPVTLRIPPGTANGRTFRVRGKGVPRKRADGTRAATCSSRSRSTYRPRCRPRPVRRSRRSATPPPATTRGPACSPATPKGA